MEIMEGRKVRVEVNSDINEFNSAECKTINEIKEKIKAKYETEDVELFYKENILTEPSVYEELLRDKTTDVDIKAIVKKHIKNLQKTKEEAREMRNTSMPIAQQGKNEETETTQTNSTEAEKNGILEDTPQSNRTNNETNNNPSGDEKTAEPIEKPEKPVQLDEKPTESTGKLPETAKETDSLVDKVKIEEEAADAIVVETDNLKKTNKPITEKPVETTHSTKKPTEPKDETTETIRVRELKTNREYLVRKNALIRINGKWYYIKKKKRLSVNINSLVGKILSRLYIMSSYLLIAGFFTLYMNKLFAVMLLTILVLYSLEKVKIRVSFRRNERLGSFILKQIVCFFSSLWLNPGHNMNVHEQEEE